ncbi:hypothetical protein SAMN02910417_00218 [Eubacterium oxidoreducens]|uniref:Uncharacterized protein n=2 Tax=Eubacterium oxidoreducens TaxID=1732 RepID=A0A1G6A3E4_EUBOX|nr:hypothetical protein SAMN02910417_00218 [Eubacterium oxidoreducens]
MVSDSVQENEDTTWQEAYSAYLERGTDGISFSEDGESTFELIYLDDNDVPELYISSGFEAKGTMCVALGTSPVVYEIHS